MKLVEIAGHLIDPGKVSYVGPVRYDRDADRYSFVVCVGGATEWRFRLKTYAIEAKDSLLAAIESARPTCCVSWPKHPLQLNEKGDPIPVRGRGLEGADVTGIGDQIVEGLMVRMSSAIQNARESDCWPKHGLNEKGGHLHGKDEIAPFPSDPPFSDYKPQPNEKGEYLWGDCWPTHPDPNKSPGDNGAMGASDALVGVEP